MSRILTAAAVLVTAGLTSIGPAAAAPPSQAQTAAAGSYFVLAGFGYDQGWRVDKHPRYLADITGDGRADIVGIGDAGVYTSIALGNGGFTPAQFVLADFGYDVGWRVDRHPRFLTDITGDGRADIVGIGIYSTYTSIARGDGTFTPALEVGTFHELDGVPTKWFAADVNGDGRTDLARLSQDAAHQLQVAHSNGNGTFGPPLVATSAYDFFNYDYETFRMVDVTGDRRAEIVAMQVVGPIRMVSSSPSPDGSVTYTAPQPAGAAFPIGLPAPSVALSAVTDVTGDGRADLVAYGTSVSGTWVARSLGNGTFDAYQLAGNEFGPEGGWRADRHPRPVADITGDGKGDIVGFGYAGVYSSVATGTGQINTAQFVVPDFGYDQGWRIEQHPRLLADITGDGRADIVGFGNPGVFTVTARGDGGFNVPPPPTTIRAPNLRGLTPTAANAALRAVGLIPGTRTTVNDPSCNFIGLVIRQSPTSGTQVDPGTVVNMWVGKPPPTPCP